MRIVCKWISYPQSIPYRLQDRKIQSGTRGMCFILPNILFWRTNLIDIKGVEPHRNSVLGASLKVSICLILTRVHKSFLEAENLGQIVPRATPRGIPHLINFQMSKSKKHRVTPKLFGFPKALTRL
jgi:hypothetical protein